MTCKTKGAAEQRAGGFERPEHETGQPAALSICSRLTSARLYLLPLFTSFLLYSRTIQNILDIQFGIAITALEVLDSDQRSGSTRRAYLMLPPLRTMSSVVQYQPVGLAGCTTLHFW